MTNAAAGAGPLNSLIGWLRGKSRQIIAWVLAAVILLAVFLVWNHFRAHKLADNIVAAPTNSDISETQNKAADKAAGQKDYSTAAQEYIVSASADVGSKNYQQAKNTLETAISKIPDDQTPYTVYDELYVAATGLKDKNLQVSSLQKALAKAEQPGSGAPAGQTDFYKQLLKGLGK